MNKIIPFFLVAFEGVVGFQLILPFRSGVCASDPIKEATKPFVEAVLPYL